MVSYDVGIEKKKVRDLSFCSPRTRLRDHYDTCFIMYVCHGECFGCSVKIYMMLYTLARQLTHYHVAGDHNTQDTDKTRPRCGRDAVKTRPRRGQDAVKG